MDVCMLQRPYGVTGLLGASALLLPTGPIKLRSLPMCHLPALTPSSVTFLLTSSPGLLTNSCSSSISLMFSTCAGLACSLAHACNTEKQNWSLTQCLPLTAHLQPIVLSSVQTSAILQAHWGFHRVSPPRWLHSSPKTPWLTPIIIIPLVFFFHWGSLISSWLVGKTMIPANSILSNLCPQLCICLLLEEITLYPSLPGNTFFSWLPR